MKVSTILFLVLPCLVFCQEQSSQDLLDDNLKKYTLEKGLITYKITGDAEGSETFAFDRFGWRSLKKRSMQFNLYEQERSQVLHEIADGSSTYRVNHGDSTYRKRVDTKWIIQAQRVNPQQASETILFELGGTYNSDSLLLDKKCQVWTFQGKSLKQLWIWEGLVLKRISKLGENNIITTANKIDLTSTIDLTLFELPTIYKLAE